LDEATQIVIIKISTYHHHSQFFLAASLDFTTFFTLSILFTFGTAPLFFYSQAVFS